MIVLLKSDFKMFKIVLRERSKRDVDRYVDEIMRKVKNEKEVSDFMILYRHSDRSAF